MAPLSRYYLVQQVAPLSDRSSVSKCGGGWTTSHQYVQSPYVVFLLLCQLIKRLRVVIQKIELVLEGNLSDGGWEPLVTRRRNMRLCMMYKIAHTVVGDPWTEWLTTSKRVTRGFHAWKYIPIYSHHNIYKFSFLPRTIIDWNSLSPHAVDSPSIDTFRARITRN